MKHKTNIKQLQKNKQNKLIAHHTFPSSSSTTKSTQGQRKELQKVNKKKKNPEIKSE